MSLPSLSYFNKSTLQSDANANSAKRWEGKGESSPLPPLRSESPPLSRPVHLFTLSTADFMFSSDESPDIHVQTRTYVNTQCKGFTPHTLSCDLLYSCDNLAWMSFHVSKNKNKNSPQRFLPPPLAGVSSSPTGVQLPEFTAVSLTAGAGTGTCHFLSGMPPPLPWVPNTLLPSVKPSLPFGKESCFLPGSQNALHILLSSPVSRGFVGAHLFVFSSHWTAGSGGRPLGCDQRCPHACLSAESEAVLHKWLLLSSFSHPQRSRAF